MLDVRFNDTREFLASQCVLPILFNIFRPLAMPDTWSSRWDLILANLGGLLVKGGLTSLDIARFDSTVCGNDSF